MKVLIINQHTLNFGDDIAGISLLQNLLEYKQINEIDIIYNTKGKLMIDNERINHNQDIMLKNMGYLKLIKYFMFRGLGVNNFKNEPLDKFIKIVNEADYIFVAPCGANIGIYKDWRFLIKLLMIIKEGKTPIFHLNTIGKSGSLIFDYLSKNVLKKSIIYVREQKSLEYIKNLGLNAKFGVDTAFSFKENESVNKKEVIAFVPTILKNWHPNFKNIDIDKLVFEEILPVIAEFSIKNNLSIELVPHLNSEIEKGYYIRILNSLKERNAIVKYREDIKNVYEYNNAIKSSKIVIGMRYHSIVLAIKNLVPFISLAYENKMKEVCDYSGKSELSLKLYDGTFNINQFKERLNYAYLNSDKIEKDLEVVRDKKLIYLSKIPLEQIKVEDK